MAIFFLLEILLIRALLFPVENIGKKHNRWFFYFCNSLLLVFFSYYLSLSPAFIEPTIKVMKSITLPAKLVLNKYFLNNSYFNADLLDSDFLLIDTSGSLELAQKKDDFDGRPVTNREKLIKLFSILEKQSGKIGPIVCDIKLQDEFVNNIDLQNAILRLASNNKIIMVAYERDDNLKKIRSYNIPVGWVNYDLVEDYVFHTPLKNDDIPTLPYLLYSTIKGTTYKNWFDTGYIAYEVSANRAWSLVYPGFVPEMYFLENDLSTKANNPSHASKSTFITQLSSFMSDVSGIDTSINSLTGERNFVHKLNDLISNEEFLSDLIPANKKPIVFIGGFNQSETDIHATAFGPMHGSMILINIYAALLNGQHRISVMYFIFLWLSFALLSRFILKEPHGLYQTSVRSDPVSVRAPDSSLNRFALYRKWYKLKKQLRKNIKMNKLSVFMKKNNKSLTYIYIIAESIVELLFDNKMYIALLVIVFFADVFFDHVLNVLGLAIYLLIFSNLISKLMKHSLPTDNKAQ